MKKNVAVLINSCDAYKDVMSLNFCALEEYWNDCIYPIYINTETVKYHHHLFNVKPLNAVNLDYTVWGKRIKDSLNRIKEEFVIVVYDDYVLESKVLTDQLDITINKMQENPKIACFYLNHSSFSLRYCPDEDLSFIDTSNYYQVNSAPAIWRRETLIKLLEDHENPWAWEFFAMYKKHARGLIFCSINADTPNVYNYNHIKGGAVYRGKWVEEVVFPKIAKYKLDIDLAQRGVIKMQDLKPRTLSWKINFFLVGFKMVGFRAFNLLPYVLKSKLKLIDKNEV